MVVGRHIAQHQYGREAVRLEAVMRMSLLRRIPQCITSAQGHIYSLMRTYDSCDNCIVFHWSTHHSWFRETLFSGGGAPKAGVTCGEVLRAWELRAISRCKKQASPENDPISPHWLPRDPSLEIPSLRAWEVEEWAWTGVIFLCQSGGRSGSWMMPLLHDPLPRGEKGQSSGQVSNLR